METLEFVKNQLFKAPIELAKRANEKDNRSQEYRTMFMRDRDRVLYSKSFRRLSGKTQIYSSGIDDHRRTRLTHTLEVSQIAATIASALGLDRDLTEAIALGHDLGHTPFGHAGEQILHEIMTPGSSYIKENNPFTEETYINYCGFKHNLQSVRTAVTLENIYGENGLDLTNYTLWGIQYHSSTSYKKGRVKSKTLTCNFYDIYNKKYLVNNNSKNVAWSFEAFVVAEADEIAQWHHDLEDAIRGNAMTIKEVQNTIKENLYNFMNEEDKLQFDKTKTKNKDNVTDPESFITTMSRVVVNTLVTRLVNCSINNLNVLKNDYDLTSKNITDFFIKTTPDEDRIKYAISYEKFSHIREMAKVLKTYPKVIKEKIHSSMAVQRMNTKGQYIIRKLFQAYYANPQQLPNHSIIQFLISVGVYKSKASAKYTYLTMGEGMIRLKLSKHFSDFSKVKTDAKFALMRVICDHIACMTDDYAKEEFNKLYN